MEITKFWLIFINFNKFETSEFLRLTQMLHWFHQKLKLIDFPDQNASVVKTQNFSLCRNLPDKSLEKYNEVRFENTQ
jgi:hypothetical protein